MFLSITTVGQAQTMLGALSSLPVVLAKSQCDGSELTVLLRSPPSVVITNGRFNVQPCFSSDFYRASLCCEAELVSDALNHLEDD